LRAARQRALRMTEQDLIGMPQSRHHVARLTVAEGVETAVQRLAVDGDRDQTSVAVGAEIEGACRQAKADVASSIPPSSA
jgi:hypothetical protein